MRIGVDIRSLADRPLSGVGEYVQELLGALLSRTDGHTYVLFANGARLVPRLPSTWPATYELRSHRIPSKLLNASFRLFHAPAIEGLLGGCDLFFAPNITFLPVPMNMPLVMTVHDLSYIHYAHLLSWRRRLWHHSVRPGKLIAEADALIAVSQSTAHDVRTTFPRSAAKVTCVPSGIHVRHGTSEENTSVQQRLHIPNRFLFSLSTLEPRKNLPALLAAFGEVRSKGWYDGDLVIAGMPGWSLAPFREMLNAHPYRDAIHVLGYVMDEEKQALYALADTFLYLSVFEGFGFPPLEALAHNCPVITGNHSSLAELVGDAALLVDVHNINDIAVAVREILHDVSLRSRLLAKRHGVLERYTWSRAAQETVAVFERTVSAKGGTS